MLKFESALNFHPPTDWLKITTIDTHTAGEPFRVIVDGFPELKGNTILERRRYAKEHYDHLRTALMWEPRGHADMYGCILTPPVTPNADFGILFIHNEGFSTMCGHGIIGITTVVLETGMMQMISPITPIKIDSPAGLITAYAHIENDHVKSVSFHNVPSFVAALDEVINVPELGKVRYDLAFGGAFYAYVNASDVGLTCSPKDYRPLIEKGMAIKRAIMRDRPIVHPFEEDLGFLYGTIFVGPPTEDGSHSQNVCIFAEGEVDRSPTGTGVSGRLAIHHRRGEIKVNQQIVIESIIGSKFTGKVVQETTFGPYAAIIPEVEGKAYLVGRNELWINPEDPLTNGFILR
ncbi:MAG: proline racemase family protein [Anaerolineae bacterium]|nr:proline racemase family protein [Anaerolineae bacterium]MCI0609779.1 proline racemase family protein [Anaerolineae bacterium]